MLSAGCHSAIRGVSRAFTLAEIILAIAIVAAVSALTASMWLPDAAAVGDRPPESVLKTAVIRARAESARLGEQTVLRFDPRGFFLISDFKTRREIARLYLRKADERAAKAPESGSEESAESGGEPRESFVKISFFARDPEIVENPGVEFPDGEIREVRFSPDSAMTPFYAVLSFSDFARTVFFDPFSGDEDDSLAKGDGE